jgi:hypothetical protein
MTGTAHVALARGLLPEELIGAHPDVAARVRVGRSGRACGGPLERDDVELVVEAFLVEVPSLDRHPVLQPAV